LVSAVLAIRYVQYFPIANEPGREQYWRDRLATEGFEVVEEYDPSVTIITIGGDGTILYAARNYADPTILPVRAGTSKGNRAAFDVDRLLEKLTSLEDGRGKLVSRAFQTLTAFKEGEELRGGFRALNEISLHHQSPVLATTFATRIDDGGTVREFPELIGDGVLVATPFGSTGYFRAITNQTFTEGFGIAFNNIHTPRDMPEMLRCSEEAVVELEVLTTKRSSGAVLTRDDDDDPYQLAAGETITVRAGDRTVDLLDIE
jgi:NAD+ kinase